MGDLISYIAHMGIVRVLTVPGFMAIALYVLYRLAAPPPWKDDDGGEPRRN
jgi:hypothetical protein